MLSYKAYDAGFMPSAGGTDAQPALFLPIMTIIATAINQEQELRREAQRRRQSQMDEYQAQQKRQAEGPQRFVTMPPARKG